jgi:hypothetical protein
MNEINRVAYVFAYNEDKNTIAVILRGTVGPWYGKDWTSNINPIGFGRATANVRDVLYKYLDDYELRDKNPNFLITGHSRGAAVANMLGVIITDRVSNKDNTFVYAFATPNTAELLDTSRNTYTNIFNILNRSDPVTSQPFYWVKFGQNRWFNASKEYGLQRDFRDITNGINFNSKSNNHNHYEEIYMTHLLAGGNTTMQSHVKVISIMCPVNVEVYDGAGVLVGQIIGNEVIENENLWFPIWLDGDEKYIILPEDGDFSFKLKGTDNGIMNFSVEISDLDTWEVSEQIIFNDVVLYNGKTMISNVGSSIEMAEVQLFITDGDNIIGEIMNDGTEIIINEHINNIVIIENDDNNTESSNPRTGIYFPIAIIVFSGALILSSARKRRKYKS